jgi:hypothetical protein
MPEQVTVDPGTGVELMGPCYSVEIGRCIDGQPNSFEHCGEFLAQYQGATGEAMREQLERMPLCPDEQAFYDETRAELPACYTDGLDACLNNPDPTTDPLPNCAAVNQAYDLDNRVTDHLPECSVQAGAAKGTNWLLVGAGALFLVGAAVYLRRAR